MYVCRSRLSQDIDCSLCFALQTCNSGIEIGTRYKNQFKYKYKQKYTNTNINRDKIIQHVDWNLNLFQGDWELKDRKSMQQEDKAPRLGISNVILILLFVSTTYYFQIARRQSKIHVYKKNAVLQHDYIHIGINVFPTKVMNTADGNIDTPRLAL